MHGGLGDTHAFCEASALPAIHLFDDVTNRIYQLLALGHLTHLVLSRQQGADLT